MGNEDLEQCENENILKNPHQQIVLEFENLSYSVRSKKSQKKILKSVCGRFNPGKLCAILGPSGAGKTSLLNILSGFRASGVSGNITVNKESLSQKTFKKLSCYITQEFTLMPLLTARETVRFAADFKFGSHINKPKKDIMVTGILNLLGLLGVSDVQVNNLSGGEKKRLSICIELLRNPPLMFLDEPTSGLDISSSMQIIRHLRNLAQENRTVVCVIHQPNSIIFEMFDDVYVMSEGSIIYGGPRENMVPVFSSFGVNCPKYYNPADVAIQLAIKQISAPLEIMIKNHKVAQTQDINESVINANKNEISNHKPLENADIEKNISVCTQTWILLKRTYFCTLRDMYLTHLRIFSSIFTGLLVGVMFYNVGNDGDKVASNIPCLFFFIFHCFFMNNIVTVLSFPIEADVIIREHLNNWYSLKSYILSKVLADLPLLTTSTTLFTVCAYFLSGQPVDVERILMLWFTCMLLVILGQTEGYVIGTFCKAQFAMYLVAIIGVTMILFSGFLVRFNDIPFFLRWLTYGSFMRFGFEGVMISIYGYNRTNLECYQPYCYFKSPRKILEEVHMADSKFEIDVIGLMVWIIIFELAFCVAIRWRIKSAM